MEAHSEVTKALEFIHDSSCPDMPVDIVKQGRLLILERLAFVLAMLKKQNFYSFD